MPAPDEWRPDPPGDGSWVVAGLVILILSAVAFVALVVSLVKLFVP